MESSKTPDSTKPVKGTKKKHKEQKMMNQKNKPVMVKESETEIQKEKIVKEDTKEDEKLDEHKYEKQRQEVTKVEEENKQQTVEKQSSKTSEYKRGKQSNQPKQNKINIPMHEISVSTVPTKGKEDRKELNIDTPNNKPEDSKSGIAQINKNETKTNEDSKNRFQDKHAKQFVPEKQTPKENEINKENMVNKQIKDKTQAKQDAKPVKLYKRQESSQASVVSEPNQKPRNRLSHAESKESWGEGEHEDATDSYHPKSEYTEDDNNDENEDQTPESNSERKSNASQTPKEVANKNLNISGTDSRADTFQEAHPQPQFSRIPRYEIVLYFYKFMKETSDIFVLEIKSLADITSTTKMTIVI